MIEIPGVLANQVRDGNAVVFLGAGASREAQKPDGTKSPTTRVLIEKLSEKFLGGKFKDAPLNQVAEYAISETDLMTVQDYMPCGNLQPARPSGGTHIRTGERPFWSVRSSEPSDAPSGPPDHRSESRYGLRRSLSSPPAAAPDRLPRQTSGAKQLRPSAIR